MKQKFAIIDLETTGARSGSDRITEIAIILHDGTQRLEEFSSLVNPDTFISPFITQLTGIDNDMVAEAPRFYEIARQIVEMTEGCTFVAHNAKFDYGFLQAAFADLGFTYSRPTLCTVKLSRKVMPGLRSYSLGNLCEHLEIENHARHRALGDADATTVLLEKLLAQGAEKYFPNAPRKDPFESFYPFIEKDSLKAIPAKAGVYYFHNQNGEVIYVGDADNLNKKVLQHLRQIRDKKNGLRLEHISDVSFEQTGSQVVAALLKSQQILQTAPRHNKAPRKGLKFGVYTYYDQNGFLRLRPGKLGGPGQTFGEFASLREAKEALFQKLHDHGLCPHFCGYEDGAGICPPGKPGSCGAACLAANKGPDAYNEKVLAALKGLGFPFPRFFIVDLGRSNDEQSFVCVENGIPLGYGYLEEEFSSGDPESVKERIRPLEQHAAITRSLRQALPRSRTSKVIPY